MLHRWERKARGYGGKFVKGKKELLSRMKPEPYPLISFAARN